MTTFADSARRGLAPALLTIALVIAGCSSTPEQQTRVERARAELNALQANDSLAGRAPVAMHEAERAVEAAEAEDDDERRAHLAFIAEQRVEIARAMAQKRYYVETREDLLRSRDQMRLDARTREAETARQEARQSAMQADASREESVQLRREIDELNARPTEEGYVLTLNDVLFETAKANLKPGAHADLDRLADFMKRFDNRDITILGHTDSVGEADYNLDLSQRRANAVKQYLVAQGIEGRRVNTVGRGESMPIANNGTTTGRQLNRRVEILIENPGMALNR